jgi:hypothetical protein
VLAFLVWATLSMGMAALSCGGILLGWSLWTGRAELWKIGLPIAAAGQISLLVGLALQLDRFWHENHRTAARLDKVGSELRDLKTSGTLKSASHAQSPAPYAHFDIGADVQLLGDLKSRLDSLAARIQDQR